MCGISGIYGSDSDKVSRGESIKKMLSALVHRGPDGWGYYISPDIALGQTRLSIVDLTTGDQPMVTDESVIVYNGEIFNYIELKAELEQFGIRFNTTSDTEVLLKAYEFYGRECFKKFNGQFAVLIWNKKTKELTIARDRFGVRPLYILTHKNKLFFSSEMKAFDQIPDYERDFDPKRLYDHCLLWNTFGDHTVYKDIKSLPGGSYAVYKDGRKVEEKRFYDLGMDPGPKFNSFAEAREAFKILMDDAVKLRLRSDVPVGAYLSGGLDSSVILNLISNHTKNKFKTFSVTFEDKEYDESAYQHEMVKHINSEYHPVNITYEQVDRAFPDAVYHIERPVFRTAPVPLYILSENVRANNYKVVLTGEGADEVLWGYDSYKELKLLEFWSKFPDSRIRPLLIKRLYPHLNHYKDEKKYGMMRMFYEGFLNDYQNELASLNIRLHNNKILHNYFNKESRVETDKHSLISELREWLPGNYDSFSLLQKNQYLEMKTLLSGYLLSSQGDRMSMAHSVEGRYPFLDHRVVDMLFTMNEEYKLKGFNQKYLLKKCYQDKIPPSIINRPKLPYMAPDLKSFIRNGKPTENTSFFLGEGIIKDYQIFNPKWVQRFLNKFTDGVPGAIGYRDNMIITFILSTQIAKYWIKNPRQNLLKDELLTTKINDYE